MAESNFSKKIPDRIAGKSLDQLGADQHGFMLSTIAGVIGQATGLFLSTSPDVRDEMHGSVISPLYGEALRKDFNMTGYVAAIKKAFSEMGLDPNFITLKKGRAVFNPAGEPGVFLHTFEQPATTRDEQETFNRRLQNYKTLLEVADRLDTDDARKKLREIWRHYGSCADDASEAKKAGTAIPACPPFRSDYKELNPAGKDGLSEPSNVPPSSQQGAPAAPVPNPDVGVPPPAAKSAPPLTGSSQKQNSGPQHKSEPFRFFPLPKQ